MTAEEIADKLKKLEEIRRRTKAPEARPLWDEEDAEYSAPLVPEDPEEDEFSYEKDVVPSEAEGKRAIPDSELTDGCRRAITSAMNILAYADNTERRLREKLARKSFTPEEIDAAVRYVTDNGYLREDAMLARAAEYLAEKKLLGKSRICVELINKGFSRDKIISIDFSEFDFPAFCARRLKNMHRIPETDLALDFVLTDKDAAAMMRAGYTYSQIREAEKLIKGL